MEPEHLLHSELTRPSSADALHLKLRHPFVPAAWQLIRFSDNSCIHAAQWADHQWKTEWADNSGVVETITFETETWLKFRDEPETKNSETETRDLKFETETRDFQICAFCRKKCHHF